MQKIRVLRLVARMNVGGPAIQISGIMKNLSQEEFDQVLVTGFCDESEMDYLIQNGIEIEKLIRINGFGRRVSLTSDLKSLFEIRKIIKRFNPDIIHTHTAKAGLIGRLASLSTFNRQIRVHTFHGHLLHGYFGKTKTRIVVAIERLLARYTHVLIAVGINVRNELVRSRIGTADKYRVIGPGLRVNKLPDKNESLDFFHLPRDTYIISWIGRMVAVKAPHRVLEIAMECKSRGLVATFVLVGDGPLMMELRRKAQSLNLPIIFLGWQSEIERILSISDLILLTSENEGTPVALIQAQMAGIPVLATNVGSTSEVMINGRSGYCLDYSAKNFVDRVEILADNPRLKTAFGAIGQNNALEHFSLDRLMSDHTKLYHELINQSKF